VDKPNLTQERLHEVLRYDPDTGEFRWRVSDNPDCRAGEIAGAAMRSDYWAIHIDGRCYRAHQLAWLYTTGEWGRPLIAHRDGDPFNNRWRNLRLAKYREDTSRRRCEVGHNARGAGIALDRFGLWTARISTPERIYVLGRFATNEAAHEAYALATRLLQAEVCST
jgi:hypothetical protein